MDCCLTKLIIFCCCFFLILSFTEIKSRVLLRLTLWERCEINKVRIGKLLIKISKLQQINLPSKAADEAVVHAVMQLHCRGLGFRNPKPLMGPIAGKAKAQEGLAASHNSLRKPTA